MTPQSLDGKEVALLVVRREPSGEDDWVVIKRRARCGDDGSAYLESDAHHPFSIRAEWLSRIRPVPDEIRPILLGAELYLPLIVGELPEQMNQMDFGKFGLQWPSTGSQER
jgi:hypothetical protein